MITPEEVKEKTIERFWSKIKFGNADECWEWQRALTKAGYGMFGLGRTVDGLMYAHRYVFTRVVDDFDNTLQVLHKCDNPACCNPNHLFAGTQKDNMRDCKNKGRASKPPHHFGSNHNKAKLNEDDISKILISVANGEHVKDVAKSYGITRQMIWLIRKGKNWKHVDRVKQIEA